MSMVSTPARVHALAARPPGTVPSRRHIELLPNLQTHMHVTNSELFADFAP